MLMPSIFGEDLFDDFFTTPFSGYRTVNNNGLMKTDIKDKKDAFEILISLPGVKKENVQADLKNGYLTINATTTKEENEEDKETKYLRRERYFGSASRSFYVGKELKEEDIKAKLDNGVLTVLVPKKDPKKPEVEEKKYICIEG
ncbi:MAG: Hsp20/alpha crystallin family protein [Lachnospiraceae bacterium]|nr:Hsp20/alpha crystallin family protein [Lachnospiraceae bacterium]